MLFEGAALAEELLDEVLVRDQAQPHKDVRVQRAAALRFDGPLLRPMLD